MGNLTAGKYWYWTSKEFCFSPKKNDYAALNAKKMERQVWSDIPQSKLSVAGVDEADVVQNVRPVERVRLELQRLVVVLKGLRVVTGALMGRWSGTLAISCMPIKTMYCFLFAFICGFVTNVHALMIGWGP